MEYPKKLIEVALPLDDINASSGKEKSIRHGHPSTLHLWWARRPLAAARAVLFAQLVNDPGGMRGYGAYKGQTKEDAQREREKLFKIIRDLVKWENINNEEVLEKARLEIRKSWEETCKITGEDATKMPSFFDPFAGGGAIPLEAQRLGLEAHACDLNPVAVMINKALIEIPPKFAGRLPIGPIPEEEKQTKIEDWSGTKGLAEDVRRYGFWMRQEAAKRIGYLYPQVDLPKEYGGGKATVIAWIWTRTVKSPNPAFSHLSVPLATTFLLSDKKDKRFWIKPIIKNNSYTFEVKSGQPEDIDKIKKGTKIGRGNFGCIYSNASISNAYIDDMAKTEGLGKRLMAVIVEGQKGRLYLSPDSEMEKIAIVPTPDWTPNVNCFGTGGSNATGRRFGFKVFSDYFLPRQLLALTTFSELIKDVRKAVVEKALSAGWLDDGLSLADGGTGVRAYSDALAVYLAFAIDRSADSWSSLTSWIPQRETIRNTFARQVFPMTWDFTEVNPFSNSTGNFMQSIFWINKTIKLFPGILEGFSEQENALTQSASLNKIVSTDPPYYDNIGYADLADFFYVWLRNNLKDIYPNLFSTISTPKAEELVALPYRHDSRDKAESFFLEGMTKVMQRLVQQHNVPYPITIYYAFKQSETKSQGTVSAGWETFLDALVNSGFFITGTWPIRTERSARSVSVGSNALASSIVLVCRKRPQNAITISRKNLLRELENNLPEALEDMIGGKDGVSPIAPVDLAQAAIGPGMAVFSKYAAVLEADGSSMSVHNALILINKAIDEYFTHAESDMDADTRFCIDWFQQFGFKEGQFGEADVLARAKGTSVEGVDEAGVVEAGGGKVRLLTVKEYPTNWDPEKDKRIPVWEACHHMCRIIQESESSAGKLLSNFPEKAEPIRQLAYRLYTICERKGWAQEAGLYNNLITSWHAIVDESRKGTKASGQTSFI